MNTWPRNVLCVSLENYTNWWNTAKMKHAFLRRVHQTTSTSNHWRVTARWTITTTHARATRSFSPLERTWVNTFKMTWYALPPTPQNAHRKFVFSTRTRTAVARRAQRVRTNTLGSQGDVTTADFRVRATTRKDILREIVQWNMKHCVEK